MLKIDRIRPSGLGVGVPDAHAFLHRSRRSIALDLKRDEAAPLVLRLCEQADALIEGFRPGVTERLGIGPEPCLARKRAPGLRPRHRVGSDRPSRPGGRPRSRLHRADRCAPCHRAAGTPTDPAAQPGRRFRRRRAVSGARCGRGAEARRSGRGQVVDAAMVDGAASLMTAFYGLRSAGLIDDARGVNLLRWRRPLLRRLRDQRWQVHRAGTHRAAVLRDPAPTPWHGARHAPTLEEARGLAGAQVQAGRARQDADARRSGPTSSKGADACFAPVLNMEDAPHHPHNRSRSTFVDGDGGWQPNAAPRFSRTPSAIRSAPVSPGQHTREALSDWGLGEDEIDALIAGGVVVQRAASDLASVPLSFRLAAGRTPSLRPLPEGEEEAGSCEAAIMATRTPPPCRWRLSPHTASRRRRDR